MTLSDDSVRDYIQSARRTFWHGVALVVALLFVGFFSLEHGYAWGSYLCVAFAGFVSGSNLMIWAFVRRFCRLLEET